MYISDIDPMDLPEPASVDQVALTLPAPLMSFVPQPSLAEAGVATVGSSHNGGPVILIEASISYTLWRNPDDHDDPVNLADLDGDTRAALDAPPIRPVPDWFLALRELSRYRMLWEAVRTTPLAETSGMTAATILTRHADHILMNRFRELRVVGDFPGELDAPVSEAHIAEVPLRLDGVRVSAMHIDTDPHVYAIGADLGDRVLTAVIARDDLPHVTLEFHTHPSALVS